jgi:hypothetical protein
VPTNELLPFLVEVRGVTGNPVVVMRRPTWREAVDFAIRWHEDTGAKAVVRVERKRPALEARP